MTKANPKVYEVNYFDSQGSEVITGQKRYTALTDEEPREMQFMAGMIAHPEAESYAVHLLTPDEVRQLIRAEKKQEAAERRQAFWHGLTEQIIDNAGLNPLLSYSALATGNLEEIRGEM